MLFTCDFQIVTQWLEAVAEEQCENFRQEIFRDNTLYSLKTKNSGFDKLANQLDPDADIRLKKPLHADDEVSHTYEVF